MVVLTEDINRLFDEAIQEISKNIRTMMENLWTNWCHMGINEDEKVRYINKLVLIEKELHRDVLSETQQKLKKMKDEVQKLKQETEELSKCLSIDITIIDFTEDMWLVDYMKKLEEQISGYREQVHLRRMEIERLSQWQRDLAEKLGATIQELPDMPLPSEEELEKLNARLEVLQAERDKRIEIFLNTQVEVKDIMEKLQIQPQNKFEAMVVSSLSVDFKVTDLNMDRLAKMHQELQEKYEQTNNRVLELREKLAKLWDCLEEDQIYRENFLQAHPGCHPHTELALKEEIKRCEAIKKQKIQVFVANMRTKIKLMWDNVMYSQREREQFIHYYQDVFTEDTLTLHEMYLDKITAFYNEHKQIFDLVQTRKSLWLKMTELESRATEPGRYHNRGGQLLKEEKERKTIANKLPKIEEQLRDLVSEYESRTGGTFTVDGKPLLKLIEDEWEARKAERHNKVVSARRAANGGPGTPHSAHTAHTGHTAQTARGGTPGSLLRSLATSPLGKRNRTAAGLPLTADRNRPPKRPLVTGSATKMGSAVANNHSALKRSAISTVKRRHSGRMAVRALATGNGEVAKRKLEYDTEKEPRQKVKVTVNASILKHKKRASNGKRRSSARLSRSLISDETAPKDPLTESTMLTTYTDFKERINGEKVSRSTLSNGKEQVPAIIVHHATPMKTPVKTPRRNEAATMTPKTGKENIQNNIITPKPNSLMYTPKRLTRSAVKVCTDGVKANDGFATPRAPLSATKQLNRQNTLGTIDINSPPVNFSRSKSHTNLVRVKNLPPLI